MFRIGPIQAKPKKSCQIWRSGKRFSYIMAAYADTGMTGLWRRFTCLMAAGKKVFGYKRK